MESKKYFSLRFRTSDSLHKRGDIYNCSARNLYIGQTPECEVKLPQHPEFADSCYAVIVAELNAWKIIRQEPEADISINGEQLGIIASLHDGCKIAFDNTVVQFSVSEGTPKAAYIQEHTPRGLWAFLIFISVILAGVIANIYHANKDAYAIFEDNLSSIYQVRADSLIVMRNNDTLSVIALDRAEIGTGFVTDNGYFVTARHCIEFWLALEDELQTNYNDISNEAVRYAIEAECDTSLRLISKVTILTKDNTREWHYTSDDFIMNKENDQVYEYGTIAQPYLWRSVISRYEDRNAELGDIAVMISPTDMTGNIHLAELKSSKSLRHGKMLYGFGYPQAENQLKAEFSCKSGRLFHESNESNECFTCEESFNKGFSGCPVFCANWPYSSGIVVGIVSRSAGNETLIVPASQILNLIKVVKR